RESQQRISTAVEAVGLRIPCKRIVINMAPADIRKEGSAYDLPLALAILAATEQIRTPAGNEAGQSRIPLGNEAGQSRIPFGNEAGQSSIPLRNETEQSSIPLGNGPGQSSSAVGNLPGQSRTPLLESTVCMGELALDGTVRPVRGALSMALHARDCGFKACIFPMESAREASVVEGIDVYGVSHLAQVLDLVEGFGGVPPLGPDTAPAPPGTTPASSGTTPASAGTTTTRVGSSSVRSGTISASAGTITTRVGSSSVRSGTTPASSGTISARVESVADFPDFAQVRGQAQARRALEVAAAGGHNVLMTGPPGAGKTFMARCLPGILPPLTREEAIETTRIWSVAGVPRSEMGLMSIRPFRAPHHTASVISLTGGGSSAMPGEISLAHNGVLYLDELPEFPGRALEVLRQPLEDGTIQLSRVRYKVSYPARFMLVASMNPCPCGFRGHPVKKCVCTEYQVQRYRNRISGPLLDRIDIHLQVKPVEVDDMIPEQPHPLFSGSSGALAESSEALAGSFGALAGSSEAFAGSSGALAESSEAFAGSSGVLAESSKAFAGSSGALAESSAEIRRRVEKARQIQRERFCNSCGIHTNAHMKVDQLSRYCQLTPACRSFFRQAALKLDLSARAYHRILRLARTIADLDGSVTIEIQHLAEAVQYK
ncbi:MAG: ATP-binding protein, partial [Synergistales bacterium]|nr:ATP-binding protein [Synergistales bacterium]